jgi:hypothetical protein
MPFEEYYIATIDDVYHHTELVQLRNSFRDFSNKTKFDTFLNELDERLPELVSNYGEVDTSVYGKVGYVMKEGWKFELLNDLLEEINVDDMEKYIGELGIRNAFEYADTCGFGDDADLKLWTDAGLQSLFFKIMYHTMEVCFNVESFDDEEEYKKEFTNKFDKMTCVELRIYLKKIIIYDAERHLRGLSKWKKDRLISECVRWTDYVNSDRGKEEIKMLSGLPHNFK